MNIGLIAEMIKKDPEILNNVSAFLERVNTKNIKQVRNIETIVKQEEYLVSFADVHGGLATKEDVEAAVKLNTSEPLVKDIERRVALVLESISSGEAVSVEQAIEKFSEG